MRNLDAPPEITVEAARRAWVNVATEYIATFLEGYALTHRELRDKIWVRSAFTDSRKAAQALVEEEIRMFSSARGRGLGPWEARQGRIDK